MNDCTVPLFPKESLQFGFDFQYLLQKIIQADPKWGLVFLMKGYIDGGFYQCWLWGEGLSQMRLVVLVYTLDGYPLIILPLVSIMGRV